MFSPPLTAGGGWKAKLEMVGGDATSWPRDFDGFMVRWTAQVQVRCWCPRSRCATWASGTRIKTAEFVGPDYVMVGYKIGSIPGLPLITSIGDLVGEVVDTLVVPFILSPEDYQLIAAKIKGSKPTTPWDIGTSWKGGTSPCASATVQPAPSPSAPPIVQK